jgi:NADPH:quinone reductase-like Zn-dependent oxidoreductase
MQAIVIKQYGGPEVLAIEDRPDPEPKVGEVLIEVKAFGVNHAEIYFRKGAWEMSLKSAVLNAPVW